MIYAIDFDGTIVENKFPSIGRLKPEAERFIRDLRARGDKWILYTMREGKYLEDALAFLAACGGLSPDAVNDNLPEMCEFYGNNPRKIFANVYIDDHNAGGLLFAGPDLKPTTPAYSSPTMPEFIAPTTEKKWCRFCKHFLPQGLLLRETPFYDEELSRDSCEKWRDYCFKPFSCKDARGSEDMCGAAGRGYQECEDRWKALGPVLQAIENYKNRNQSKKPQKRSWWKLLLFGK